MSLRLASSRVRCDDFHLMMSSSNVQNLSEGKVIIMEVMLYVFVWFFLLMKFVYAIMVHSVHLFWFVLNDG